MPAVRDQGSYGTCWAHAVLCAAEVDRIQDGAETADNVDFSELQLAWFHCTGTKKDDGTYNDPLNNFGGDHNICSPGNVWNRGGNDYESGLSLASWIGPTQTVPSTAYNETNMDNITANGLPYSSAFSEDSAHLTGMQMIPWREGDDVIKEAIMENGAVTMSYWHDDAEKYFTYDANNTYYFMSATRSEIDYEPNHAVTIVGWDDNILKDNFVDHYTDDSPDVNGAWIVRNSWGPNWGDDGYFYMSYETKHVSADPESSWAEDYVSILDFDESDNYARCYQYDGTSSLTSRGYPNEVTYANVFTATENERIDAVSFWLFSSGVNYTISIYTDITDNADPTDPTDGTLVDTVPGGTTQYTGYYTVDLPTSVPINKDSKFSVVIRFEKSGTIFVPLDMPYSDYASYALPGQSFVLYNGASSWQDLNKDPIANVNCRIKAFTTDIPVTDITVSSAESKTEVEVDKTLQMSAVVVPENATNRAVKWSVTPGTGTATIHEDSGLLTGKTAGTVTVKATAADGTGIFGEMVITVTDKIVHSITVVVPNYLEVDADVTCSNTFTPSTAEFTCTWSVTNGTGTATIDADSGLLTGKTAGTVTVKATADNGVHGEKVVTIVAAESLHEIKVPVSETDSGTVPAEELYIDGVVYRAADGGIKIDETTPTTSTYSTEVPKTTASTAVVYQFNKDAATADPHEVFPTNMAVWELTYDETGKNYQATRKEVFDNLLVYAGSSIRITGVKGIRMITSVPVSTRNQLIAAGIDGYRLEEYGTLIAWTDVVTATNPLVLGSKNVKSNYAYKRGVADPIFRQSSTFVQYTNVLINLTDANCKPDISMRPYIKLKNAANEELVLYGGIIVRSVGYIAYRNRSAFAPKTAAYEYIWSIIRSVYGNKYNNEYKG